MGIFLRLPFSAKDDREPIASWTITLFLMLVSGFVAYEICTEWPTAKAAFLVVPGTLSELLGYSELNGWFKGIWMLFVFPVLFWLILGSMVLAAKGARSLGEALRRLALPLAPLIAAGHMSKGLAKISSWGGYLPLALTEPSGVQHAKALTDGTLLAPQHLFSMLFVSIISLSLILAMAFLGVRESRLADRESHGARLLPLLFVGSLELVIVCGWTFGT